MSTDQPNSFYLFFFIFIFFAVFPEDQKINLVSPYAFDVSNFCNSFWSCHSNGMFFVRMPKWLCCGTWDLKQILRLKTNLSKSWKTLFSCIKSIIPDYYLFKLQIHGTTLNSLKTRRLSTLAFTHCTFVLFLFVLILSLLLIY